MLCKYIHFINSVSAVNFGTDHTVLNYALLFLQHDREICNLYRKPRNMEIHIKTFKKLHTKPVLFHLTVAGVFLIKEK